jgi:hypothetical protein
MPSLAEIWRALHGAWRLLFLDTRGLGEFDGTRGGGLRSLWAIALVLPFNVAIVAIEQLIRTGDAPVASHNIALDIVGESVKWLILIAIMYGLVSWHGRAERFWLFVSSFNWIQVPLAAVILVSVALLAGTSGLVDPNADPANVSVLTAFAAQIAFGVAVTLWLGTFVYEWYVAWVALDSGLPLPIIVVLLDAVMGFGLNHLSTALS